MTLPSKITIGPFRYTVSCDADAHMREEHALGRRLAGRIDYGRQLITLNPAQGPDQMADTLLHEVLHGVFNISAIDLAGKEEEIIGALTSTLLDTFRRNPKLVAYLMGDK